MVLLLIRYTLLFYIVLRTVSCNHFLFYYPNMGTGTLVPFHLLLPVVKEISSLDSSTTVVMELNADLCDRNNHASSTSSSSSSLSSSMQTATCSFSRYLNPEHPTVVSHTGAHHHHFSSGGESGRDICILLILCSQTIPAKF